MSVVTMFHPFDILTYAVLLGCEYFALCAMTRGGRGWTAKILGLVLLVAVNVATECVWLLGNLPSDAWLAVQFIACWIVISGLTLWLSRDSLGRRIFLALCYGTYATGYASCFDVIVYRLFAGTAACRAPVWSVAIGLAVVAFLNFAFVRWILPNLPRDGRNVRWGDSCFDAGVMFAAMFACSCWPVSVVSAPVRDCVPFLLVSVAAWIVFPMVCGRMRDRQRTADIEHSLNLMMAEVKVRRAAIDLARRLRHDQRHHRAQIAEYMLAGQYDRVFDYLKALDEEAQNAPTDKLVWCENETVNAVLSGASRRATARSASLEAEVHVERTLPFPDVQLVAVLANLIENAIEAVEKWRSDIPVASEGGREKWRSDIPVASEGGRIDSLSEATGKSLLHCGRMDSMSEATGKSLLHCGRMDSMSEATGKSLLHCGPSWGKVTVSLRQREHGLGITVTNPVPDGFSLSPSGLPCAEPGIGLESIRRVVERYDGQWSYELKDGTLKCQVILMFPTADKP